MEALFRRYFQCKSTGQLQLSRGLNFSVRVGAPKILADWRISVRCINLKYARICAYVRNNYVYISDNENVMKVHIITRWYARFHSNKSACKFEQFEILNNVKIHISMRYSAWFCTIDNGANRAIRSSLKNRGKVLKNVKYYILQKSPDLRRFVLICTGFFLICAGKSYKKIPARNCATFFTSVHQHTTFSVLMGVTIDEDDDHYVWNDQQQKYHCCDHCCDVRGLMLIHASCVIVLV